MGRNNHDPLVESEWVTLLDNYPSLMTDGVFSIYPPALLQEHFLPHPNKDPFTVFYPRARAVMLI